MAHGNIYPTERVDAALGNYFRVGNLTALRELALMWVADQVDDSLQRYRETHGIEDQWETRERIVVALTGAPGGDDLIRRAARVAVRARGDLLGVHVRNVDGLVEPTGGQLDDHRAMLQALGGTYHEVSGADVAPALVRFAEAQNATQIVLGASRRSRWRELISGSVINQVNRLTDDVDVHIIPTAREALSLPRLSKRSRSLDVLSARRRRIGWVLAFVIPIAVSGLLLPFRGHVGLTTDLFAFLLGVLAVSTIGGLGPAVTAAVVAFGLGNWFFTPPIHTFSIDKSENLFSLFAFLVVASAVGLLVGSASRRAAEAARARSEAETLAALAAAISRSDDRLEVIVEQLRNAFGTRSAALLRRVGSGWTTEAAVGEDPPIRPDQGFRAVPIDIETMAVLAGEPANGIDDDVLAAFCAQLGDALERRRLQQEARRAVELAELNELRSALLNSVSHDLRTPLAAIKAAASSLRQPDISWSTADEAEFLATIEGQTDRLTALITNLLGMSQIEAGAVDLTTRAIGLEEVISRVLAEINDRGHEVQVDVPETLPEVDVDPTLLERVVANLVDNACKWSPDGAPVRLSAAASEGFVTLQVVDQGPGIPRSEREAVFEPFQRRGDTAAVEGTGLGLAVARGFTRVMGGTLEIDDTPGGGATLRLGLPIATPAASTA
jgi:two-component system sensor histidine kinase KdpD